MFLPCNNHISKIDNSPVLNNTWFTSETFVNNTDKQFINIETSENRSFPSNIIKTKKIKLFLTTPQKLLGVYRYYYNLAIQYINNYDKKTKNTHYYTNKNEETSLKTINLTDVKCIFSMKTMRKYLKDNNPEWMDKSDIYSHVIDKAFSEAEFRYKTCMTIYKKTKRPFLMKFKTKKDKIQTFNIESNMFNTYKLNSKNNKFKKMFFGKVKGSDGCSLFNNLRLSKNYKKIEHVKMADSSITHNTKLNEFYLNYVYTCDVKKDPKILNNKKVISIDPGIKTFMTCYTDNSVINIGMNIKSKIDKLCKQVDILNSMIYKKKTEGKSIIKKREKKEKPKKEKVPKICKKSTKIKKDGEKIRNRRRNKKRKLQKKMLKKRLLRSLKIRKQEIINNKKMKKEKKKQKKQKKGKKQKKEKKKEENVECKKVFLYSSNRRRNLKRVMHKKIKKLEQLKNELHNKAIKYLVSNYGRIIIPNLEIQEMSMKFNSKLARSLYNLSYGKMMMKLKEKSEEYNVNLIVRPEYYTSKTCTRCGNIKQGLKLSDRIYECERCKLVIDRDINAARNIMLRNN